MNEQLMRLVFPEQASTVAARVDALYLALTALSGLVSAAVVFFVIYFSIRYRRRAPGEVGRTVVEGPVLEVAWIAVPTVAFIGIFFWGAWLYFSLARPPAEAADVYVTGRKWMWKFQHPDGYREINDLHVPLHKPIRLIMSSEDVIHSFFVPAFRVKQDVVPGRFTEVWFEATKPGVYWLFCAEYCGTLHSKMIGRVYVMEPADYIRWRSGGAGEAGLSLPAQGERLYQQLGCASCHTPGPAARGPQLDGLLGRQVALEGGGTVKADESYIRESIFQPQAKLAAGFEPIMPTYAGQVTEEQAVALIAYLKTLRAPEEPPK